MADPPIGHRPDQRFPLPPRMLRPPPPGGRILFRSWANRCPQSRSQPRGAFT